MEQRAFWITLTIILFYLIARPRIGTVWYVNADNAELSSSALQGSTPAHVDPANPFGGPSPQAAGSFGGSSATLPPVVACTIAKASALTSRGGLRKRLGMAKSYHDTPLRYSCDKYLTEPLPA